jgi:hypothetical protein
MFRVILICLMLGRILDVQLSASDAESPNTSPNTSSDDESELPQWEYWWPAGKHPKSDSKKVTPAEKMQENK